MTFSLAADDTSPPTQLRPPAPAAAQAQMNRHMAGPANVEAPQCRFAAASAGASHNPPTGKASALPIRQSNRSRIVFRGRLLVHAKRRMPRHIRHAQAAALRMEGGLQQRNLVVRREPLPTESSRSRKAATASASPERAFASLRGRESSMVCHNSSLCASSPTAAKPSRRPFRANQR